MTKLSARKTKLIFESADEIREQGRYRAVIVEATPHMAVVRLRGLRTSFAVPWGALYHQAAKMEARRLLTEKKGRKR